MATIQKYVCDSMFCKYIGEHILAIIKNDETIYESDITCTDSIEKFYTTDTECAQFEWELK